MTFRRRGAGCGLGLVLLAAGAGFAFAMVYPFLARQAPVPADTLVVEGWVSDDLLVQAAGWAGSNGVKKIVATGGPVETGSWLAEWKTYAEMTRARMDALGLGATFELAAVPAEKVRRGRTRESARALRAAGAAAGAFNVASEGPHARRSWRAFRDEFAGQAEVGSVALTPIEYDGTDWWRCSEGVRKVIDEAIAYAYDLLAGSGGE
ncbi:MAG TPA: hypothetical protein P5204_12235 [Kiritimatiellia bacterium]|nr:hypothetical protein [Kiritimatiellia bacterium]